MKKPITAQFVLQPERAKEQSYMVIKNNGGDADIKFNGHIIKPGEELRLPMAPITPRTEKLNDIVERSGRLVDLMGEANEIVDERSNGALSAALAARRYEVMAQTPNREALSYWKNDRPLEPKTFKRIDKITKY